MRHPSGLVGQYSSKGSTTAEELEILISWSVTSGEEIERHRFVDIDDVITIESIKGRKRDSYKRNTLARACPCESINDCGESTMHCL